MLEPVDEFLDKKDWAVEATYTASGEDPVAILVIFSRVRSDFEAGQTVYVNAEIVASCRSTDVENATNDATLKIGTMTYKVIEKGPDVNGMTELGLSLD